MGVWLRLTHGFHLRHLIVALTLFSHMMITFGFPLPNPNRKLKGTSHPFPCQNRPCGCLTSEQCWEGDCCCFTIEDKLTWAESNGVEPPAHVRSLVESRKIHTTTLKKPCCAEPEIEADAVSPMSITPTCCEKRTSANVTCCSEMPACENEPVTECPLCASKPQSNCCEQKSSAPGKEPTVHWVVGIFTQKCRSGGTAGLLQLDPVVIPILSPVYLAEPERGDRIVTRSQQCTSLTHSPPTRPPRSC